MSDWFKTPAADGVSARFENVQRYKKESDYSWVEFPTDMEKKVLGFGGVGRVIAARSSPVVVKTMPADEQAVAEILSLLLLAPEPLIMPPLNFDAVFPEIGRAYVRLLLPRGAPDIEMDFQALAFFTLRALQGLARRGVLSGDIKPANTVYLSTDGKQVVPVLVDFGMAQLVPAARGIAMRPIAYTYPFRSRRQSNKMCSTLPSHFEFEEDLYALGATLLSVFVGEIWSAIDTCTKTSLLERDARREEAFAKLLKKSDASGDVVSLLAYMMQVRLPPGTLDGRSLAWYEKRRQDNPPTASCALTHPWLLESYTSLSDSIDLWRPALASRLCREGPWQQHLSYLVSSSRAWGPPKASFQETWDESVPILTSMIRMRDVERTDSVLFEVLPLALTVAFQRCHDGNEMFDVDVLSQCLLHALIVFGVHSPMSLAESIGILSWYKKRPRQLVPPTADRIWLLRYGDRKLDAVGVLLRLASTLSYALQQRSPSDVADVIEAVYRETLSDSEIKARGTLRATPSPEDVSLLKAAITESSLRMTVSLLSDTDPKSSLFAQVLSSASPFRDAKFDGRQARKSLASFDLHLASPEDHFSGSLPYDMAQREKKRQSTSDAAAKPAVTNLSKRVRQ